MKILICPTKTCQRQRVIRDEVVPGKKYYVNEKKTCPRCEWENDKMVRDVQENLV